MTKSPIFLCLAATIGFGLALPAAALCPNGQELPSHAGKKIVAADDTLFFRTSVIHLDIDGSPSAYGVDDQGTENICNGLASLAPPECRGVASRECTPYCQASFLKWHRNGARLEDL